LGRVSALPKFIQEDTMQFISHHPQATIDTMGFITLWLSEHNPAPAKEQLHRGYAHGRGWRPFEGFTLGADDSLKYPNDPPMKPFCEVSLRDERVVMYPHAWVAIIQPDRSFEVCRMD
jgi:hypothetical protein